MEKNEGSTPGTSETQGTKKPTSDQSSQEVIKPVIKVENADKVVSKLINFFEKPSSDSK